MSLSLKLAALGEAGTPVRAGLIGAGKFGSMFLSQAPRTPGLHVAGIADLDVAFDEADPTVRFRRETETAFRHGAAV